MLNHSHSGISRARLWMVIVMVGTGLTMWFWLDLWLGGGLIGGDVYSYYFPQKSFYSDAIRSGESPFWNSLVGFGYSAAAESQTAEFYPTTWPLYRWLDMNIAYNVNHLLHYVIAFVAVVLLAGELGIGISGGLLAGLAFVYGWFAPRCCLEWAIVTGCYLPLQLWLLLRFQRLRQPICLLGLSAAVGLQLLGGHFHLAFISLLTLTGWTITSWMFGRSQKPNTHAQPHPEAGQANSELTTDTAQHRRRWGMNDGLIVPIMGPGLAIGLGILLATVQLLPTWDLKQNSQRQSAATIDYEASYGHVPPRYLTQTFLPWLWYGMPMQELNAAINRPGFGAVAGDTNPVEAHLYWGWIPFCLSIVGAVTILRRRRGPDFQLLILGLLGVLGVIYALGWLLPLGQSLPGFSYFRGLGRYGIVACLAGSLYAARGWQLLSDRLPIFGQRVLFVVIFGLTVVDLSWVSQQVTYAYMVAETPLTARDESPIRELLADQLPPARLFAPGPNLPTVTGVAAVPVYLGIGPASYFDPDLAYPDSPTGNTPATFGTNFTDSQLAWLRHAGVTHILGFAPPDANSDDLKMIWAGFDPLLNPAWGRGEPLYLSELTQSRGRAAWLNPNIGSEQMPNSLQWRSYQPTQIELRVSVSEPDMLVVTDLYDDDWQVTVDGQSRELSPVEGQFRGVPIAAGDEIVRMTYRPWSIRVGFWVSIAAFTIWLTAVVWTIGPRRNAVNN